jgi:hypothetical protein
MKKIMSLCTIAGLCLLTSLSSTGQTEVTGNMCYAVKQVVDGFGNQFEELYEPETMIESPGGLLQWDSKISLPGFREGYIMNSKEAGEWSFRFIGEFDEEKYNEGPADALILTCLRLAGFTLVAANTEEDEESGIENIEYKLQNDLLMAEILTEITESVTIEFHVTEGLE